jgi:hypothetical protein
MATMLSPREWRLTLVQTGSAAILATAIGLALGHRFPLFAPLTAVTLIQVLCAPHRRGLWLFLFGEVNGALAVTVFIPNFSTRHAALNALTGAVTAIGVAYATTPRDPVKLVNEAIEPVLTRLAYNVRTIASALRAGDAATAAAAVESLNDIEEELDRLKEVLLQVRRSAVLTGTSAKNIKAYRSTATEIRYAVRNIRTLARHAWWGMLRTGEPVPSGMPQMLESLADGLAVLRDEIHKDSQPHEARPLLISAGRWIDIMRSQPISISAAAVAASADAAVLDLLIATGVPLEDADQMLHRPSYG